MDNRTKNKFNPIWLILAAVGLLVAIIMIVIFVRTNRTNPYGKEIVISDFDEFFNGVDENTKNNTFATLYKTVVSNYDGEIGTLENAVIRDGSVDVTESYKTRRGSFIVDVPQFKQSYEGSVTWSVGGGKKAVGYVSTFSCLPEDKLIYGSFQCKDSNTPKESEVPICDKLPIRESSYDTASRMASVYTISCYYESLESAKLIINDFSGGNYENALNKIRELGFDPEKYTIEYNNKGGNN